MEQEQRDEIVVMLRSRRFKRMVKVQAIQHLVPSYLLLVAGFEALHHVVLLGIFEIIAGGLMLVVVFWELWSKQHHEGAGVRAADLFAAAMLLAEALNKAHEGGRYLPYAYVLISALMAIRAFLLNSWIDRRRLVLNNHGFRFVKRFGTIQLPWTSVREVKVHPRRIEISTDSKPIHIHISEYENQAEIAEAFRSYRRPI
jgi:hypothetical protein